MAWDNLASNQMVSYTDAQTSGFALKPGQSQVTSSQCMTKLDIITKYYVNISGYSDNQLVPKNAWTGTSYSFGFTLLSTTAPGACTFSFPRIRFSPDSVISENITIYTDAALTAPFNGGGNWFGIQGTNLSWQINTSGLIVNSYDCIVE